MKPDPFEAKLSAISLIGFVIFVHIGHSGERNINAVALLLLISLSAKFPRSLLSILPAY
jgi:hypothetical protein